MCHVVHVRYHRYLELKSPCASHISANATLRAEDDVLCCFFEAFRGSNLLQDNRLEGLT